MMLKDILTLKNRLFGPRAGNTPACKGSQRYRLSLEILEDRCLPSLTVLPPFTGSYSVTTFAPPPSLAVKATGPDSIAVDRSGEHVFVGYNNGTAKDGTDGLTSTIVEYSASGAVLHVWQTPGHNDGLKIDPNTDKVWVLDNEDGNPNLVVINPKTFAASLYFFPVPDNGGPAGTPGGFDDITFLHGKVYMTESNPDPTSTGSAVVQVRLPNHSDPISNQVIIVSQVLPNHTTATDASGNTVSLFISDADSMTAHGNNLVFTSQSDNVVLTIHNPGPTQTVSVATVHDAQNKTFEVDDTIFTPSSHGSVLVVDSGGTVYKISGSAVIKGLVLSSADTSQALGTFDPKTGLFTPVINGFKGQPKGLAFLPASPGHGSDGDDDGNGSDGDGGSAAPNLVAMYGSTVVEQTAISLGSSSLAADGTAIGLLVGQAIVNPVPADMAGNSAVSNPRAADASHARLEQGRPKSRGDGVDDALGSAELLPPKANI